MNDLEYQSPRTATGADRFAWWRPLLMLCFGALSFVVGLATYVGYIAVRYRQRIGPGDNDFWVVVLVGMLCYGSVALPIWSAVLAIARGWLARHQATNAIRCAMYVSLPIAASVLPTIVLMLPFGGGPSSLFSAEGVALLLFIAAGATYGARLSPVLWLASLGRLITHPDR